MKKIATVGLAALMITTSTLTAAPASAQPGWGYGGYGYRHHDHDDAGLAVGVGLFALIAGLAIASSSHPSQPERPPEAYQAPPPPPSYNAPPPPPNYAPPAAQVQGNPKLCTGRAQVWDEQTQTYVMRDVQYAC